MTAVQCFGVFDCSAVQWHPARPAVRVAVRVAV